MSVYFYLDSDVCEIYRYRELPRLCILTFTLLILNGRCTVPRHVLPHDSTSARSHPILTLAFAFLTHAIRARTRLSPVRAAYTRTVGNNPSAHKLTSRASVSQLVICGPVI
jgi:hypothetical protein